MEELNGMFVQLMIMLAVGGMICVGFVLAYFIYKGVKKAAYSLFKIEL